tara:strand:+ start:667 stop:1104 length:438 start_codon:yes stop_codon:yes gene_type:complete
VGSFEDDLRKFEAKTNRKLTQLGRKVALELFKRVIYKTPVDTGRARANWQVTIGAQASGTIAIDDTNGGATMSKATAASAGFRAGDTIYLTNNLPYIRKLEEGGYPDGPKTVGGFSRQAPAGMVALTVQEFAQVVNQISVEVSRQ